MTTALTAGTRLRSQVCHTEVIVVRPGQGSVVPTCGGLPLVGLDESDGELAPVDPALMTGTTMGKRYTAADDVGFELLVTKPGAGTLGDGTTPLIMREAKPLPASD